ncbi:MAG: acyl-CoA dehydrogenase family protein [Actinomycetota bacterium]|nr:acyl-CoA dehydrogenase family protein [Actinomycetota bacterium]
MIRWAGVDADAVLLTAIAAAVPEWQVAREFFDDSACLPDQVVQQLRGTGVFRMALSTDLGGSETDPLTQIRAVEMLAEVDASLGWYAMVGSDSGFFASFLDPGAARRLYGPDPNVITAGFLEAAGQAIPTEGGYLVSGRWPFGSASRHSTWLASGCRVGTGDIGHPEHGRWVVAIMPRAECRLVEDSWQTLGLKGSGSFDYLAEQVFVPTDQVFSFLDGPRSTHPLHRFPLMYRAKSCGVALGVARGAIAERRQAIVAKRSVVTGRSVGESHHVHQALGRAEALTGAARCYAYATVAELWQVLCDGQVPEDELRVRFRLMLAQVTQNCRDAVGYLFTAAGGSAIYRRNMLERRFRDIHTISQHALAHDRTFETAGKALLGLPLDEPMFC